MPPTPPSSPPSLSARDRIARCLTSAALLVLLAALCSRAFIAEMPFRIQPVRNIAAAMRPTDESSALVEADRGETARIVFALALLGAVALWAAGGAVAARLNVSCWPIGAGAVLFAVGSLGGVLAASDRPSAWLGWIEQLSLIAAGFVTIQLARDGRGLRLIALTAAGLAITLGVKALYQFGWEIPERIAYFHAYGSAAAGLAEGDPGQAQLASRILDDTVSGFFSLANLFGAELCILAAVGAGLAGAKIASARRQAKLGPARPKGQIPPAPIAAALTAIGAALAVAALVLTRSRGAIGAFFSVAVAVAFGIRLRAWLERHWRAAALVAVALLMLGASAVVAVGLSRDRLGVKTLTIRWFYWTASADILAAHPAQGVGPGNFAAAYLAVRRPEAEEAVKTPHNAPLHALVQFGWPSGLVWIALAGSMVVLAWRPGPAKPRPPVERITVLNPTIVIAFAAVASITARWAMAGAAGENVSVLIIDAVLPGALLAAGLALAAWWPGRDQHQSDEARWLRPALACGAAAFAVHNLVTFGFWAPGVATAFWISAGAAVGSAGRTGRDLRGGRWAVLAGAAVLLGAGCVIARPIFARQAAAADVALALRSRQPLIVRAAAERLARADDSDALSAMSAARVFAALGDHARAMDLAGEATRRDPKRSSAWRLRAEAAEALGRPAGTFYDRAIELDPANARLRLAYAGWLLRRGQIDQGGLQIRAARRIDAALRSFDPQSDALLSPADWARFKPFSR